jgi:hypothetical protein
VLGVGLGHEPTGEFNPDRFGEEPDPRARARLLDELPGPEALAELAAEVRALRGPAGTEGFDLVVTNPPETDTEPWVAAGATWCPTGCGSQATLAEVRRAIDAAGP